MKLTKAFRAGMIPVFIPGVVTVVMSVAIYNQMTRLEEELELTRAANEAKPLDVNKLIRTAAKYCTAKHSDKNA